MFPLGFYFRFDVYAFCVIFSYLIKVVALHISFVAISLCWWIKIFNNSGHSYCVSLLAAASCLAFLPHAARQRAVVARVNCPDGKVDDSSVICLSARQLDHTHTHTHTGIETCRWVVVKWNGRHIATGRDARVCTMMTVVYTSTKLHNVLYTIIHDGCSDEFRAKNLRIS